MSFTSKTTVQTTQFHFLVSNWPNIIKEFSELGKTVGMMVGCTGIAVDLKASDPLLIEAKVLNSLVNYSQLQPPHHYKGTVYRCCHRDLGSVVKHHLSIGKGEGPAQLRHLKDTEWPLPPQFSSMTRFALQKRGWPAMESWEKQRRVADVSCDSSLEYCMRDKGHVISPQTFRSHL